MTFEAPDIGTQLQRFNPTDAAIAEMRERYMPLTIAGLPDVEGFNRVHDARMVVRDYRVQVEKTRKELKADALDYGRKVDAEAKRITALLEPIETHLQTEEERITQERWKIKHAAQIKAEEEEKARKEAEAVALRAEQDRLAQERAALDAERKAMEEAQAAERQRQRAEQDRLDGERRAVEAERQRLADIEAARLRKIEDERIAAEAAERARIETEQRIAQQAALVDAARIKAEAMRPDCDKLHAVAVAVSAIAVPAVSPEAAAFAKRVQLVLLESAAAIDAIVADMNPTPF